MNTPENGAPVPTDLPETNALVAPVEPVVHVGAPETSSTGNPLFDAVVSGQFDADEESPEVVVTKRVLACTKVLRLSVVSTSPRWAFPLSSLGSTFQTASQAPRSDHPASSGTIWMGKALPGQCSMTA